MSFFVEVIKRTEVLIPLDYVPLWQTRTVFVTSIVFLALSWITALLRFGTRAFIVRAFGKDDITLLAGLVSITLSSIWSMYLILISLATLFWVYGFYYDHFTFHCATRNSAFYSHDISDECKQPFHACSNSNLITSTQLLYGTEILYTATIVLLKISAGLLFLRFMVVKWHRNFIWGLMILSTTFGTAYCFFIIFQCGVPWSRLPFWEKRLNEQCVSSKSMIAISYTHGIITALTDFCFALAPVIALWKAQISKREKLILCSLLGLGVL